jgi:hypothetical protein
MRLMLLAILPLTAQAAVIEPETLQSEACTNAQIAGAACGAAVGVCVSPLPGVDLADVSPPFLSVPRRS